MTDDSESNSEGVSQISEQELVKIFKRRLEYNRELYTIYHSVLRWEKPFYPGLIAASITSLFLVIWYFSPSVLTTVSIFGICFCIFDYVVPIISASVCDASKWTASKERKFEELCKGMASISVQMQNTYSFVQQIKGTKPYLYFVGVLGTLIITASIGNSIDNLFLTYLIVLSLLLLPGIKSKKIVQENMSKVLSMVQGLTGGQDKKKK